MLKYAALLLLVPSLAFAQAPQAPEVQACQSKLLETIVRELEIRAQLFTAQKQISDLTAAQPQAAPDSAK